MGSLEECEKGTGEDPPAHQLLALAERSWHEGNHGVTELLVDAVERQGVATPESLLWKAIAQLNQSKYQDFWSTISRASALAPEDPRLTSILTKVSEVARTYIVNSQECVMEIRDAADFIETYPERGESLQLCEIQEHGAVRPLRIHTLYDTLVIGCEGSIIDPSTATIFKNSFSSMRQEAVTGSAVEPGLKADLAEAYYISGMTAHLCGRWSGNFFHWISELLPRAFMLHKIGFQGWYLVPNCPHPFIADSLEMLGIPRDRILRNQSNQALRCEALVTFDSWWFLHHYDTPWIIEELRERLLSQVDSTSPLPDNSRGIYIMRRGHRAVRNNDEVRALLTSSGILPIRAEELTFKEQISLAARSRFLFGPHGAGLTLALFMPPQSTMVEFVPADSLNVCYDYIAQLQGHRHFMVPSIDSKDYDKHRVEPSITLLKQIVRREMSGATPCRSPGI